MLSLFHRLKALWGKKPQAPSPLPPQKQQLPIAAGQDRKSINQPTGDVPFDSTLSSLSEAGVYHALRQCRDPEIPVNIVDLGLIYDVRIQEDLVQVKMTLTTQGCGMGGHIAQEAQEQIRALPGVREAKVDIVWDPPWNPSMISQAGRKILGLPEE
jgi:metal-sulfur cluster biosynthetic enzyme